MLAQRRRRLPNIILQLGQCILVVDFLTTGMKISPLQNAGLLLGHRRTRLVNIEATLVSRPVIAVDAGIEESCVRSVLK